MNYVVPSAATSRAAEIMGGGRSGGRRLGALGMRRPERVRKRDGFIVRKECPWMPPASFEGEVAAHALSAVFQQLTEAFVGWVLTVLRRGSSLWRDPARMSAMDIIVWVGAVWR